MKPFIRTQIIPMISKYLACFIFLLFLNLTGSAQAGCKYNGNFSAILSEVKSRNKDAPTAGDRLTDAEARKVAKYWELDCKCRNGVSTQQEARALANEAFLNTSNNFYKGNGVNQEKKNLSYLGDLKTPFAVFTPGSCMGNGGGYGSDFGSRVNCAPEASRIKSLDGQLGAYASTFFMAYCKCKAGVSSKEEASALIAQMKTNHRNFNNMRNGATQPLSTQPLTSCNIVSERGRGTGGGSGSKKLIKDEWMGLLNDLAANSDNEVFNEMVGTINEVKGKVSQMQDYANMIAPEVLDQDFFNTMENTGNSIAMVGAGIDLISSLFEKKEPQYTESQIEAYKAYDKISSGLLVMYDEIATVPTYYEYNQATLSKVEKREKLISEYGINTAKQRLLCLRYLLSEGETLPDKQDLVAIMHQIDALNDQEALSQIQELTGNNKGSFALPLHLYSELGFAGARDKINKYKSLYYEKAGNHAEAEKYKSKINYNVSYQDAVRLTLSSFKEENYIAASKYGRLLFDLFRDEKEAALIYTDLPDLHGNPANIYRADINKLMVMTIVSDVKNNKMTQAKTDLDELIQFHERLKNLKPGKKDIHTMGLKNEQLPASEAMVRAAQAYIYSAENKHEESLSEINHAIALYKGMDILYSGAYSDWLNYLKLEILIAKKDYKEAGIRLKELKGQSQYMSNGRLYPAEKLNFINAYIRYETGDNNGALVALKILEKKMPDAPKVYALKEKVYLKVNNAEMAKESRNKYVELITKR